MPHAAPGFMRTVQDTLKRVLADDRIVVSVVEKPFQRLLPPLIRQS